MIKQWESIYDIRMINFDSIIEKNIKVNDSNWPKISDQSYIISIIGGSGSGE